ncbi:MULTISPECIES: hypothetical protein [unclassified Microcoleus]
MVESISAVLPIARAHHPSNRGDRLPPTAQLWQIGCKPFEFKFIKL